MYNPLVYLLIGLVLLFGAGILFFKWGWRALYVLLPVSAALSVYIITQAGGFGAEFITLVISPTAVGITGGYVFRKGKSYQFYILVSTLPLVFLLSVHYYGLKIYGNHDLVIESRNRITAIIQKSELPDPEKKELLNRMDGSVEMLGDIMPFTYFLNTMFITLLGFFLLKYLLFRYFSRMGSETESIAFFKLNDYFIFVLIAGWAIVLLMDKKAFYWAFVSGLNLALVFSVLYLLQAVGIVKFLLRKKGLPAFILPAALLGILLLGVEVILFFSVILLSIGAIDFWADFRKLETQVKQ